jgi:hypothetical protein
LAADAAESMIHALKCMNLPKQPFKKTSHFGLDIKFFQHGLTALFIRCSHHGINKTVNTSLLQCLHAILLNGFIFNVLMLCLSNDSYLKAGMLIPFCLIVYFKSPPKSLLHNLFPDCLSSSLTLFYKSSAPLFF